MTDDERERIEREARHKADTDSRLASLEKQLGLILKGLGVVATAIGISIWNTLSGGIFK